MKRQTGFNIGKSNKKMTRKIKDLEKIPMSKCITNVDKSLIKRRDYEYTQGDSPRYIKGCV